MPKPQTPDLPENQLAPFHMFRFQVSFTRANLPRAEAKPTSEVPLCSGAFAECTGIEATIPSWATDTSPALFENERACGASAEADHWMWPSCRSRPCACRW